MKDILFHYHSSNFGGQRTVMKVLQSEFSCPMLFKDACLFVMHGDRCQSAGNISTRQEMPLHGILEVGLFDMWGIDFMGLFLP